MSAPKLFATITYIATIVCAGFMTVWADEPSRDATEFSAEDRAFFEKSIRPLLARRCYECHSNRAKKLRGGLYLDSRDGMLKGGDSGPAIEPGDPESSLLIEAVGYESDFLQMPPSGKLPKREIALLAEWVKRGAPGPAEEGDALSASASSRRKIDFDEARQFWSFQPAKKSTPPATRNPDWVQRRIDAFVLRELEQKGLTPSPRADRRMLIRRATFDLLGLPPTPDEIQAFVSNERPDAYAHLIDRLLASPHYGERWGRFWLDLARYSDTTATWLRTESSPYLYRDWVIQALNDDVPYDEFVKRQLATDLIPQTGVEDTPALGFLGLSPTYWKELKLDKEVIKAVVSDEWEERINAVTGTFLGLTVACARCHDHKYDPITVEDYYALAGVLASTRLVDTPIIPEPLATRAKDARDRVKALNIEMKKLRAKKGRSDEDLAGVDALKAEIEQLHHTPYFNTPLAPGVCDASVYVLADGPSRTKLDYKSGASRDLCVEIRGNPSNLGPVVPRRFLTVLSPAEPVPFKNGSGRLELAEAIVGDAAGLSARVMVNRVWKEHFGKGLVDTPSNFGSQGMRPTHPSLLDDLAARFIEHNWSIKWLHREIMLSATYQQSSAHDSQKYAADPENRWLWRMNRRRLPVESWRDAVLCAAHTLDCRVYGPSVDLTDSQNVRRTIYGTVARRELNDMLRLYDFPDPNAHSPARENTTTALQQLFVLNSPFMWNQAGSLAHRLNRECAGNMESTVRRAYELVYGRPARDRELQLALDFLRKGDVDEVESFRLWQEYVQVLLGSNEFMFID